MISGFATAEGTKNFKQNSSVNPMNFNIFETLHLSNVGMGTYLGDSDAKTDELVKNAVKQSVMSGINVIDTAINYRGQKAERSVGRAMLELVEEKGCKPCNIKLKSRKDLKDTDMVLTLDCR